MPQGRHSQATPYKNKALFFREKQKTPPSAVTEPQLSHRSLLSAEAMEPAHPVLIQKEVLSLLWPHHSCLFKELWLQSVWRGNTCLLSFFSLPHLQCVPWQQSLILQVTEGERTEGRCHQHSVSFSATYGLDLLQEIS